MMNEDGGVLLAHAGFFWTCWLQWTTRRTTLRPRPAELRDKPSIRLSSLPHSSRGNKDSKNIAQALARVPDLQGRKEGRKEQDEMRVRFVDDRPGELYGRTSRQV
eukprot:CAMPEP_0119374022 /NCGR_PEP_ID=MMETSP1334-20130426/28372_1 /TAXON_ID=127549 /ORGANISM="Calcidiscus leptoporus, Strain RCC1130" /LENGTH=104 /DNA_ID=CAMNT_0007391951 /DNA_START=136 /DNA_END=450 /DNA_ORIENTATION=-